VDELEKYFEMGDHVKVCNGRRAGVTGTVVRVEGEIIQVHIHTYIPALIHKYVHKACSL